FGEAKAGATGLEVLLPLTLRWAEAAGVALPAALARITAAPAEVLGLQSGQLAVGATADVCIFDPAAIWQLTPDTLKSRGKNSPWTGYLMSGKVKATLVGGRVVYQA
ncbi:MAG: amidohydrolase family protein, partial [Candidatus Dechloromonas phosphoritropha]